jgi:universal stress protein A
MHNYRHVVLATDFSELGRAAVRRGLLEARAHAARATLVHVIEHFPDVVPHYWIAPEDIDPTTYYRGQGAEQLARFATELECEGVAQEVIVTAGSAGHAIAEFGKQQQADLIVAGIHGAWAIGMLGSTAMALAREAPCDVLLVR